MSAGPEKLPHEIWHLRQKPPEITVRAIPEPEVMPRLASTDEMPSAAKSFAKKLYENGWVVETLYGKHSWPKQAEVVEDDSGAEEKVTYGIVESIVVKGRRGKQRCFGIWMTKPWTKSGDAYSFYTGHIIPDVGKVKSPELKRLIAEGGEEHGSEEGDSGVQPDGGAAGDG